jgi:dTMP kinase
VKVTPTSPKTRGLLLAFEGLDQSGKQTQAERLKEEIEQRGRRCVLLDFPSYETHIGQEIDEGLHGGRDYAPDVMQLLYVANRYEKKPLLQQLLETGTVIVCDRYMASSIAYGEAQGLDPAWLLDVQRYLPPPDLTILLDIAPETAAGRKQSNRDKYERDLALLSRVRDSYRRQAAAPNWVRMDGERAKDVVAADVLTAVVPLL